MKGACAAVFLFLAVVATGCGGGSSKGADPVYAGMPRSAALNAAKVESGSETGDGSSELYGHHLRLVSLTKGRDLDGTPAWQATFADLTQNGQRHCIWMAEGQFSGGVTLQPCKEP